MTSPFASSDDAQSSGNPIAQLLAGHYELRERLGEGGYGEVYAAWDHKLQRRVAIKRIKEAPGTRVGDAPMREARMAASLGHAAFVKVHGIEEDGASQSIIMELVPGRTVKQFIEGAGVDLQAALNWVGQVAEAMQDAHESGLVHGDLKPSNLMVEPSGRVRILDFGLALRHDAMATRSVPLADPVGTITYMAPERFHGVAPDARCDVYALGVILYELACGTRPHAGLNGLALAAAHLNSNSASWTYPDNMSAPVVRLIRAMTAREPQLRIESMAEVRLRLGQLEAPPTALSNLYSRWGWQRKRWHKAGWTALVVFALAIAGWQLAPMAGGLLNNVAPYSQAQHMHEGLEALKVSDRPGSLEKAARHFSQVLEKTPENAAATAGMALVYAVRYEDDGADPRWMNEAVAHADRALRLNDQLALSHVANGWVLDIQRKYEPALNAHEQALHLDPGNFFALQGKVQVLRSLQRYPEAMATLALATARFPQERLFLDELGTVLYNQGDYRRAADAFRSSIAMQPDAVTAYSNLGAALLMDKLEDEALRVFQRGLEVRPSAKLYGNLGNALFLRGDYVRAAAAFQNAVSPTRGAPGHFLNWANLADTLWVMPGRKQEARDAYAQARKLMTPHLQRAPEDAALLARMGLYEARSGDSASALKLMEKALTLAPNDKGVQFRAGVVYELHGNRQLALEAIAQAKRLGYSEGLIGAEPDLDALRRDRAYQ